MEVSETTHFGDTSLGECLGIAIIILAVCIGTGSCNAIQSAATCHHDEQTEEVSQDAKAQTEAIAVDSMTTIAIEAE